MSISLATGKKIGNNLLKAFKTKPMGVAAKGLGFAFLCSTLYDAHLNGKQKAISTDRIDTADRFERQYQNYAAMNGKSHTLAAVKNFWFECQQNFPFYHIWSKTCGYLSGLSKTLVFNLPLIGLSAAALATRKFPKLGKTAGALLALNAAAKFIFDVVGIGSSNKK